MAQDYDVSLKLLFRRSNGVAIQRLLGESVVEWLNVELPRVANRRVDMLGRTASGGYAHLELQSTNSPGLELRQAAYYLDLYIALGRHVDSAVLYVGKAPLSMNSEFRTETMLYRYRLVDIRDFDGEELLASDDLGDAMMALLTRIDKDKVGRRVWPEIEKMEPGKREDTLTEFLIISGLRDLEDWVLERARQLMPLSIDVILENKVIGPAFRRRSEEIAKQAMEEGRAQGMQQGMQQGEIAILQRLLQSRFGPLPSAFTTRLHSANLDELAAIADRALTAATLEEVFPSV